MKKMVVGLLLAICAASCMKGQAVDMIVHNARIHTMDRSDNIAEAMAIRDGKIVEVGPDRQIMNKYSAEEYLDAEKKDIFPGFTDAHGHILSYARQLLSVDLVGCKSMNELIVRVEKYSQSKKAAACILGRGWDQSLWETGVLPSNEQLNALFPNTPVVLYRIDGHAALVNQKALDMAGITPETVVPGGSVTVKDGKCTGLLLDNAIALVSDKLPDFHQKELIGAIEKVQQELLQFGITGVHEAGVEQKEYQLLQKMVESGKLHLDLYVMLRPTTENIVFAKKNGRIANKNMIVRSFKIIGDGALGSHGALLKQPYTDKPDYNGLLTTTPEEMNRIALIAEAIGYQVNIHAIGDSTNKIALDLLKGIHSRNADHRWRIEHVQVVDPADFTFFAETGVFPSVQPTHAVSDQRWAEARLGKKRLKGAYAYKTLLEHCGMLALGTDFPVEPTNPYLTIHAAVNRKNADGEPIDGFLSGEALTVHECLMGMTVWPAYASFQESRIGSLEKGKDATFAILAFPFEVKKVFTENYAFKVFIKGKERYTSE